jgi:hypothetical protein
MDELLQKLLEAEVLSEDTKKELEEAFNGKLDEAVEAAKAEAAADVRAELTEQWVQERDALIEAVDSKVSEFLDGEISELKEDIERFRDLEAEFAEKLVEAKSEMGEELKGDLGELVEKLDAFLEIRLGAELEELREDIDTVRQNEFGRKIFEAVAEEYAHSYADDESLEGNLRETESRLEDTTSALEESETKLSTLERTIKMQEILQPLEGSSREVMETILKSVPTEQLEEGYKTFIGRVLKETIADDDTSEKEDKVLAEDKSDKGNKEDIIEGDLVTGDNDDLITENEKEEQDGRVQLSEETRTRLQRLAGLRE